MYVCVYVSLGLVWDKAQSQAESEEMQSKSWGESKRESWERQHTAQRAPRFPLPVLFYFYLSLLCPAVLCSAAQQNLRFV